MTTERHINTIVAENVSKSFGAVHVLQDVSFQVKENELYGFIGPDGAGKTTLFRILTSLMVPGGGYVKILGNNVVEDYREIRKITGYMPGKFSLYQDLSVEENLSFFASVFGTRMEDNYEVIKDVYVQIEPFGKRLAGQLSGGMKQKLALCCALIHSPKLLVLDEPTTGVDAVSRLEFWELLKGLKDKGITIVVATPYMDEANMCERVSLIQNGKILKTDTPARIAESYGKSLYAIRSEDMYKLMLDLEDYPGGESVFSFGESVHYTDKERSANIEELKNYLQTRNNSGVQVEEIEPGIEDVFMQLMSREKNMMDVD